MQGVTEFVINSLVSLSSGDLLWRVFHFAREMICYRDRYDGILQVAELAFSGSSWSLNILSLQALSCVYTKNYGDLWRIMSQSIGFGIVYCVFTYKYNNSRLASINWLRKSSCGLDCASSMASGYFHGYLNIILPNKGNGNKNISERIEDFEDKHKIEIPVKKLILLLPKDFYAPPLLSDFKDLDTIGNLEFTRRDVAGTTNRPYSNTVYKIIKKKYYVVAEAATPLKTFFERYHKDISMEKNFPEVYEKFYQVLEELLWESPGCREKYLLVRYSNKTLSGEMTDVAQLLSDVIEKEIAKGSQTSAN